MTISSPMICYIKLMDQKKKRLEEGRMEEGCCILNLEILWINFDLIGTLQQ